MAKTLEQLLSLSSIIANETKAGANTALRVGGLFSDIIYYLRDLDYADKDDIPSLEGYATEQWVLGKGYATTSDLDNRIDALVNGAPAAYDTLKEIADVLAENVNSIDDILTALGTKVSKDDFNTAIANVNNSISALNTELSGKIDLKLDAVTFNELFEKVKLEDGTWAIKAKLGLFSESFISAKGANSSGGSSPSGGAVALYQLNDVLADGQQVSGASKGALLMYNGTKWEGVSQSEITPDLTGYATESWVLSQGFLTQHQDLSDYAKLTDIPTIPTTDINKGVTAYGWGDHSKVGYLTSHQSLDGYVNEIATSGNGNAITSVSKSGKKITFTKGATYLTGITSKLVTDALGYTPYDAANFTKAKIKSTLGISDWALASSKPSYTTKEVSEDTNLYFTNARAVAALKSITDGLSKNISTLQGYFTDGAANSALKLATARTIWGQSFDGTGNVSGNLSGVGDIYMSNNKYICSKTADGSDNHNIIGLNSSHTLLINSDARTRNSNVVLYGNVITIANYTDKTRIGRIDIKDGNVGIDKDNPSYKLDVNGTTRTTKLVIGNGSIEWDETNKGFKIAGGLYTESYLSAKGANTNGGGSSGGGLITSLYRYADLGKTFSDTNNDTFNAYTINKINADLGSRISVLEGKATNVSFTQSLTSGTQIGTITIDGASKNIYAPTIPTADINKGVTAYGWGDHSKVGYLTGITSKLVTDALGYTPYDSANFTKANIKSTLGIADWALASSKPSYKFSEITEKPTTIGGYGITDAITTGNIGSQSVSYATSAGSANVIALTYANQSINFTFNESKIRLIMNVLSDWETLGFPIQYSSGISVLTGYTGWQMVSYGAPSISPNPYYRAVSDKNVWTNWRKLAFLDDNVASATKLQTARTIWGQSFDGTGNIVGTLTSNTTKDKYRVTYNVYYQGVEMYASNLSVGDQIGMNVGQSYAAKKMAYLGYYQGADDATTRLTLGLHSVDNILIINAIGNVGIGTTSPKYKLDVNGVIHSNTGIFSDGYVSAKGQNTSSDMRLKNVLNEVVLGVKDIANAPSVRFSWKNGGGIDVGSSAQYWQGLLPDAVKERDGMLEMQYANIALLSAIALAKNFETMDERVARLEKENKELRTKIDMMERR